MTSCNMRHLTNIFNFTGIVNDRFSARLLGADRNQEIGHHPREWACLNREADSERARNGRQCRSDNQGLPGEEEPVHTDTRGPQKAEKLPDQIEASARESCQLNAQLHCKMQLAVGINVWSRGKNKEKARCKVMGRLIWNLTINF